MSDRHFIIITTDFSESVDQTSFTATLDKGIDWVQITPTTWLLWTKSSAEKWYIRMKQYAKPGNRIFICEVNPEDRSGFMPSSFWDFIKSKTSTKDA
jgi:hypothetical protein